MHRTDEGEDVKKNAYVIEQDTHLIKKNSRCQLKALFFLSFSSPFLNFLRKSSPIKWVLFLKSIYKSEK